jgi:hypothetical protein
MAFFIFLLRNRWLLPQTFRRRLGAQVPIRQQIVSVPLPGRPVLKLWHDDLSSDVTKEILLGGFASYENGTPCFFLNRCRKVRVVLDIGANIGYYSILPALSPIPMSRSSPSNMSRSFIIA